MNNKEKAYKGCLWSLVAAAGLMMAAVLLGGCTTTKYVPVIEHRTDTLTMTKYERDSIYVHDSTTIKEKGDTVLVERWHTQYRDRWHHDSIYISKSDSIPTPCPVEVEVPAELTWWQQARMTVGTLALMSLVVILIWKLKRFLP